MPGRTRLERQIVAECLAAARSLGAYAEKTHGDVYTRRGTLDITGCYHGLYIAFEAKRDEYQQVTPIQQRTIDEIRAAGGVAEVVWSAAQVRHILEAL